MKYDLMASKEMCGSSFLTDNRHHGWVNGWLSDPDVFETIVLVLKDLILIRKIWTILHPIFNLLITLKHTEEYLEYSNFYDTYKPSYHTQKLVSWNGDIAKTLDEVSISGLIMLDLSEIFDIITNFLCTKKQ